MILERDQIDQADLRLAYVQHPFPTQGQTTDTAHLIVSEHATQEGSYVALTRARERTHLYASLEQLELENDREPLPALTERLGRTEPQVPSIDTPLAHEAVIDQDISRETDSPERAPRRKPWIATLGSEPDSDSPERPAWERATAAIEQYRARYDIDPDDAALLGPQPPAGSFQQAHERRQATATVLEALDELEIDRRKRPPIEERSRRLPELAIENRDLKTSYGWEL